MSVKAFFAPLQALPEKDEDGKTLLGIANDTAPLEYRHHPNDPSNEEIGNAEKLHIATEDSSNVQVEIFVPLGDPCPWQRIWPASITPGDTSSEESFGWAQKQLSSCLSYHEICKSAIATPYLPRRVLDIRNNGEDSSVRLRETQDEQGQYLCLSYCWGDPATVLKTTKATLHSQTRRIEWDIFPKTYQDAISFSRRLGFDWIWIDSLCIIQDDLDDRRREAAKMASIYRNCQLTIVAAKAANSREGCFSLSPHHPTGRISLRDRDGIAYAVYCRCPSFHLNDSSVDSEVLDAAFPVRRRGWIYQERMLPPRLLYFGPDELIWECLEDYQCECEPVGISHMGPKKTPKIWHEMALEGIGGLPIDSRVYQWHRTVEDFCSRKLSNPSDRLPAISGLAQQMAFYRPGCYLGGLWSDSIILDLLWNVSSYSWPGRGRRGEWRAPSWSWASIDYEVEYNDTAYTKVVDAACSSPEGEEFERLFSGSLKVWGPMLSLLGMSKRGFPYIGDMSPYMLFPNVALAMTGNQCWHDVTLSWAIKNDPSYYLLRIADTEDDPGTFLGGAYSYWLLLRRLEGYEYTFERVGLQCEPIV